MPPPSQHPRDEIVQHVPLMRVYAQSLTHDADRADDLVEATIRTAWNLLADQKPDPNLRSWLCATLRKGYHADPHRWQRDGAYPDAPSGDPIVGPTHGGALPSPDFLAAFARLSLEHRETLTVLVAFGFTVEEAATIMEVTVDALEKRSNVARFSLQLLLEFGATDGQGALQHSAARETNAKALRGTM